MAETKFTPGPWIISNSDYFNEATNSHLVIKTGNDDWEICHLCDGINGDIGTTIIANGCLIEAAPDMYKMLEKISQVFISMKVTILANEIDILLAKARGENPQP